ncbi:hypothetical protein B0I33_102175 [Prauserella shujinwangii]|uniref:Glycosyltransferase A (GT-A) superfamily protein (DUF2064 family) n=1 Tax=Prauserella shujinwangii TaxID=1453103 RepID=A0A2T0M0F1_9PSEU|nr:DUF2064 domain-containing protein [Prauserella shujinwangii]PRX50058.1 hypothetical protein B0I33_102175 [Prauserella shujinwangii]
MNARCCVLVVAKAPVPGLAKTRLCPPATPAQAADLAAAALLDTLDTVLATDEAAPFVALTGDLSTAARGTELAAALRRCTVLTQRGRHFGERLAHAHADTARAAPGLPVVQIGMDTPQVRPALLGTIARRLRGGEDAVLGPATDGGWWALGLRDPRGAAVLANVPMSRPDTGRLTRKALEAAGLRAGETIEMSDVDTMADAGAVADAAPDGRFAAALRAVAPRAGSA